MNIMKHFILLYRVGTFVKHKIKLCKLAQYLWIKKKNANTNRCLF